MKTSLFVPLVLGMLLVVTGCAGTAETVQPEPSSTTESAYGGFPIDPPAIDEVVLTVTSDTSRDYSYGELLDLATVAITIDEPFIGKEQSFEAIPLAQLFADAAIPDTATVETVALNDYRYADTVSSWKEGGALLAVRRNGDLIPMDAGGPIRIVFPSSSTSFDNLSAWNWSLRAIEVVAG